MYIPPTDDTIPSYAGAKLSLSDVERVMQKHELWKYGSTSPGQRAHFAYADLSGLDLTGIDFNMASFEYANLSNVNFTGCNLSKNSFRHSDCSGVNFSNTNLEYSNFMQADLSNAIFTPSVQLHCVGNGKELKTISVCKFLVTYSSHYMTIGCMHHSLDWWESCTLEDIENVYSDSDAAYLYGLISIVLSFVNQAPCIEVNYG
jgi:uncharacterized protein YjbI with pentapeptide repeats